MFKRWLQRKLINFIAGRLFNSVTENDILRITGKDATGAPIMFYKGKRLSREQVDKLIDSAELFKDSDIWRLLKAELKFQANQRMYRRSQTPEDFIAGKIALFIVDMIDKKIREITE